MAGFELYADREPRHRRTWTAAIIILGFVFILISQFLPLIPWLVHYWPMIIAHGKLPAPTIDGLFIIEETALTILLIWGWVWLFERRPIKTLGLNHSGPRRFLRGYLIGCGALAAVVCGLWACGVYTVEGPGIWQAPSVAAIGAILGYAVVFVVQGSSEELLMRGWLMGTLASRHGVKIAIIINALLFGLMHLGNPVAGPELWAGVANVALFGVFISLYAFKERSLWGVCAFHGAWNWLLGIGFGLEVSGLNLKASPLIIDLKDAPGTPWYLSGGTWGPEASILTTLILLGGIAVLWVQRAHKPGDSFATPEKPLPVVNFVRQ